MGDCCRDWVIAYITVLSVVSVIALIAFIVWRWKVNEIKKRRAEEQDYGTEKAKAQGLPPDAEMARSLPPTIIPQADPEEIEAAEAGDGAGGLVLQRFESGSGTNASGNQRFATPRTSLASMSSASRSGFLRSITGRNPSTSVSRADSFHSAAEGPDEPAPANNNCMIQ